jgi:VWFA-related protein
MKPGVACALAAIAISALEAQQPAPTFRVATTLVEFTLVAEDGRGNPITDLTRDEIEVAEGGVLRDLAFFRYDGDATAPAAPLPLPPNLFTNRLEYEPNPPRNIVALVMDGLNSSLADQVTMREQLMRYLIKVPSDTRVAIYWLGTRVEVLHDFTSDLRELQAALERDAARARLPKDQRARETSDMPYRMLNTAVSEMAKVDAAYSEQQQYGRAANTWAGLYAIGSHLSVIPGRKSLVWLTAGIPIVYDKNRTFTSYERALRNAAQYLSSLNVVLYPVDATGLRGPEVNMGASFGADAAERQPGLYTLPGSTPPRTPQAPPSRINSVDTRRFAMMAIAAAVTGGRVLKNSNDLTSGMKEAIADLKGTYSVGFYAPDAADDMWHEFTVKVRRPGVKVTQRQGYLSRSKTAAPQDWTGEMWQAIVTNAIGSSAIRVDARPQITKGDLIVILQVVADDLYFRPNGKEATAELDIALAERMPSDAATHRGFLKTIRVNPAKITYQVDQIRTAQSILVRVPQRWQIQPETRAVRVIVRDRMTAKYGIVDIPLSDLQAH